MYLIYNKNNSLILFITFVLVALSPSTGNAAEINKWIDEQGKIHYGAQPPSDRSSTRVAKPAPVNGAPTSATPDIVLYSTSWCGYCRQARAFMEENNISYTERDIEKDRTGKLEYDRLGGRGVPFLVRNGEDILRGFRVQSYQRFFSRDWFVVE